MSEQTMIYWVDAMTPLMLVAMIAGLLGLLILFIRVHTNSLRNRFEMDQRLMMMQIEMATKAKHVERIEPDRFVSGIGDDGELIFESEEHGTLRDTD